jgi:hypothetical protein
MINSEKLNKTFQIRNFVESWFFDEFCANKYNYSQDELVDRIWSFFSYSNDIDLESCCKDASDKGFIVDSDDIKNYLADFAGDVVFNMYEDDLLPDMYASVLMSMI